MALYLKISNPGAAPTSIDAIELGYHWHLKPFAKQWLKYRVGWFWLVNQSVALTNFQVLIGEDIKVYPFLSQRNQLSNAQPNTYLRIGESTNGVIYFEQDESWGGCFPSSSDGFTDIKLRVRDAQERQYISRHKIPVVNFEEAKKYNPRFGETHITLRGEFLPSSEELISKETPREQNEDIDPA